MLHEFHQPASARRRAVPAILATAILLLASMAGCGAGGDGVYGAEKASIALSQAKILPDPKAWDGAVHAGLPEEMIHPVATDPTPRLPVTVTDSQGTKVTVRSDRRILALDIYGTLSQTVFDLGLGKNVVGRDISTEFKEAARLPLVTSNGHDLVAEKILALHPSVILTDSSLGPWNVILQMRDAGIPVVVVSSHRGLDNIAGLTEQVATALGVPAEGKRLADRTMAQVRATETAIAEVAPQTLQGKLRTIFLYVRGQAGVYYMFGEGSGSDDLIDAIGGYDVAKEIGWSGMKPVTDEAIIKAQPDVILMMTLGLQSVGGVDGLLKRMPAIAQTPAGQHHRIIDMDDGQILGFGPATPEVLNSLAVGMYAPEDDQPSAGGS